MYLVPNNYRDAAIKHRGVYPEVSRGHSLVLAVILFNNLIACFTMNKKFYSFLNIFTKPYTVSHVQVSIINICLKRHNRKGTGDIRLNFG